MIAATVYTPGDPIRNPRSPEETSFSAESMYCFAVLRWVKSLVLWKSLRKRRALPHKPFIQLGPKEVSWTLGEGMVK